MLKSVILSKIFKKNHILYICKNLHILLFKIRIKYFKKLRFLYFNFPLIEVLSIEICNDLLLKYV